MIHRLLSSFNRLLLSPLLSYPCCLLTGLGVRVVLIYLGILQDASASGVKYTDVDYSVYTDAAGLVWRGTGAGEGSNNGASPYDRATYRYTPLLAWMLVPTAWGGGDGGLGSLWPHSGKLLFALLDIALAAVVRSILLLRGVSSESATRRGAWCVLFNPLVINLSTRGNADTIIVLLVALMVHALLKGRTNLAAILFGLAVHVKIYPIIYGLAIILFLNEDYPSDEVAGPKGEIATRSTLVKGSSSSNKRPTLTVAPASAALAARRRASLLRDLFHPLRLKLRFALVSSLVFLGLTLVCYARYGDRFLYETYLYHVVRKDTRHNFSVYFLQLYLQASERLQSAATATTAATAMDAAADGSSADLVGVMLDRYFPLLSFLPQFLVLLVTSLSLYTDLPLVLFVNTLSFVTWNKVVTAQYFLWWAVPLLVVAPQSNMGYKAATALGALWMTSEATWLYTGLRVEFRGEGGSAFTTMWGAGVAFFLANVTLLVAVVANHRFQPVFRNGQRTSIEELEAKEEDAASAAAATKKDR